MPIGPRDSLDLTTLSHQYAHGNCTPAEVLAEVNRRVTACPDPAVFITKLNRDQIDSQITAILDRQARGIAQPLFGIPFAVKDNIDVAGVPTTAACPAFAYTSAKSAFIVRRLCDAGAIVVGKTNLDQFATGLVGTRSPHGACKNPFDPRFISGGSSSGSAVAVASGLVSFALGTDTAGSGRVPAGFCNLVGWKPTRGLLSTSGLVPACRSLDCISVFSLTCDDAQAVANVAVDFDAADPFARPLESLPVRVFPTNDLRIGVPRALEFFGNRDAEENFRSAVEKLAGQGARIFEIDDEPFTQVARLLYNGPWVAERYLAIRDLIEKHPEALMPVTRSIIEKGAGFSAVDTFAALEGLAALRRQTEPVWAGIDVMLVPTSGTIYTIDEINADPFTLNSNLGRYTNFVNLLDLSALAVPNGFQSNGIPTGITFIAPAGADAALLRIGGRWMRQTAKTLGATDAPLPSAAAVTADPRTARLAVVGAHLSGMPLNGQLTSIGAKLVLSARTAPIYRLYALPGTVPPKPGMLRVGPAQGVAIEIEVYEMSHDAFGKFIAAIPSPLGIGTVLLEDQTSVHGFLCESAAVAGAPDISAFGGWRKYTTSQKT